MPTCVSKCKHRETKQRVCVIFKDTEKSGVKARHHQLSQHAPALVYGPSAWLAVSQTRQAAPKCRRCIFRPAAGRSLPQSVSLVPVWLFQLSWFCCTLAVRSQDSSCWAIQGRGFNNLEDGERSNQTNAKESWCRKIHSVVCHWFVPFAFFQHLPFNSQYVYYSMHICEHICGHFYAFSWGSLTTFAWFYETNSHKSFYMTLLQPFFMPYNSIGCFMVTHISELTSIGWIGCYM